MAVAEITAITIDAEEGETYKGKVVKVLESGMFVNILPNKDGYLAFIDIEDAGLKPNSISEGQELEVTVQNVDKRSGRMKLSLAKKR